MAIKLKVTNYLIALLGFLLIIVFVSTSFVLRDAYNGLINPYFDWLHRIGYYQYVYSPHCNHCFFNNLPDLAPAVLLVATPLLGSIALCYYFLSDDKALLKRQVLSLLFGRKLESGNTTNLKNNKKIDYFSYGLIIAFFCLIGVLIIVPIIAILLDHK